MELQGWTSGWSNNYDGCGEEMYVMSLMTGKLTTTREDTYSERGKIPL